jgi:sugar/nucleoside kinase (ribokinase family)/ribulose-5-phosphate 4-epimerase/fuculose-1-phosphate aldolase
LSDVRLTSSVVYRPDSDELRAARAQLVNYSARMLGDGLAVGSAGNISMRVGDLVVITPSGIGYHEMAPADVCVVALDGTVLHAPQAPSSETPMHLAVYAATAATAVVHSHSAEVIALSSARAELPAIHYAITGLGGPVRVARYVRFGSAGLAAAAVEALTDRRAAILQNHGAIAYGAGLEQAYDRALLLEWLARVYRLALAYGEPRILTAAELAEVAAESGRRRYGERRRPAGRPGGRVVALGAHILDVLGRPVEAIPPGQGSVRLQEIRATAAGTAAGTGVDLAKLGAQVFAVGALGADLMAEVLVSAMARHGVDTTGLVRKSGVQTSATILPIRSNGERPALHVPGATSRLELADIDLDQVRRAAALLVGAPDALGELVADGLPQVVAAARSAGALVVVDVLHPGSPRDLDRLGGLLGAADWFLPNSDQLLALTGRDHLAAAIEDVLALGTGGVAVTLGAGGCLVAWPGSGEPIALPAIAVDVVDTTGCGDGFSAGMITGLLLGVSPVDAAWLGMACGSLVATGLGSDAGIEDLDQVVDFLRSAQPAVADRIAAARRPAGDGRDPLT